MIYNWYGGFLVIISETDINKVKQLYWKLSGNKFVFFESLNKLIKMMGVLFIFAFISLDNSSLKACLPKKNKIEQSDWITTTKVAEGRFSC
jgi:hypothetical protein